MIFFFFFFDSEIVFDSEIFLKKLFVKQKRSIVLIKIIKITKNLILKQRILSSEIFLVNFLMGSLPNNILYYL